MATQYFNLPVFESTDTVDLIGVYNVAMAAIDTALHEIQQTAIKDFNPQPLTDNDVTVSKLNTAKVTSNGIIYDSTVVNNS